MTIRTTTNSKKAKIDDPNGMMAPWLTGNGERPLGTTVRQDERRAAGCNDVHRDGAHRIGRGDFGVPVRAAVLDARGAVLVPFLDANRRSAVERHHRHRW